jgi:phosphoglycerol transferase MdoB-like AlkP superfamily enzyme
MFCAIVILSTVFILSNSFKTYRFFKNNISRYPEFPQRSLSQYGVLSAFFLDALSKNFYKELPTKKEVAVALASYENASEIKFENKPNIYLIIIESLWIDNGIFSKEGFIHDSFRQLLDDSKTRYAITNERFGGTSVTEAEVLCGFPNLFFEKTFNMKLNSGLSCIPNILKKYGYKSYAFHPFTYTFWNRNYAYPRIGFDEYYSLGDFDRVEDEFFLPDNYFFSQSLNRIKKLNQLNHSNFYHLLTVRTHYPFPLPKQEEMLIQPIVNNELLYNYVNSIFYTTKYLSSFINDIKKIDNKAKIIILGDHSPPLGVSIYNESYLKSTGKNFDSYDAYRVPLLLLGFDKNNLNKRDYMTYQLFEMILKELDSDLYKETIQAKIVPKKNINYIHNLSYSEVEGFKEIRKGNTYFKKYLLEKENLKKVFLDKFIGNKYYLNLN